MPRARTPEAERPTILPRAKPQLTDAHIKALPIRAKRYAEFFGLGFGVRVTPDGSKTFVYYFRHEGRKRSMSLGTYPALSLAEARKRHRTHLRRVEEDGIDAASEAQQAKAEAIADAQAADRKARNAATFRDVFDHWQRVDLTLSEDEDGERQGRKDGGASVRAQFDRHVFGKLGDMPIREVGRAALLELVDNTKAAGKRRTAHHLFANLRQMLDFAVEREHIDRNPLAALRTRKIVGKPKARDRALADWETTRLLQRLPIVGLHVVTVLALRFVLATGQRPDEVAGMRKAELHEGGTLWRIPPGRYKTNMEQLVPLSKYAQDLLAEAARYNGDSEHVFPSPTNKPATLGVPAVDRPIDRHSLSKAIARKLGTAVAKDAIPAQGELGIARFVPHDLRRTMRTGLAALGVPDHIGEKVLGHRLSGVLAVYNQHDYIPERRDALDRWGEKLTALAA
jgi:integrase